MKNLIKIIMVLAGMVASLEAAPKVSIPDRIDLPPDFKPSAAHLSSNRRFGFPEGWGCEIGPVNGLLPLYITRVPKGALRGERLTTGDLILAVDGEPLVADPLGVLNRKFGVAKETNAKLALTRWRAGSIDNVTVPATVEIPDFTQGDIHDGWHDWTLGPTGLRGWIFGSQSQTSEARQILVTEVAKGSPADGKFLVGDVILGLGRQKFTDDARISFAKAIATAESESGCGKFPLLRWRAGQTETVELQLKVMGTYSDTAPYDCPKSKKVFELGCAAIAKQGLKGESIPNDLNALALLASGQAEYRPMLAAYAKQVSEHRFMGYPNWDYGYANIFLAEYVLATGDQSVFAGLQRITSEIVRGQSAVGTWGHRPALPNGNINGYGCMNQPGLSLTISLVLARAAGVQSPELDRALAKSLGFLRWYAGKGAIPYGDHQPWNSHDDGGKTGAAALLFDLAGDRWAAEFFAKMAAAGYAERESAHVGNYFCYLWALPAVIRCGPLASGAYLKEQSWSYDLARRWDGSVIYQGPPQGGQEYEKYTKWDCTGSYLLGFAAPQKSLYLTGKKLFSFPALNRTQTAAVMAAGRDFAPGTEATCYSGRTTEQLLAGLSNWSPAVRYRSAQSLAKRNGDFVPTLLKLLSGKNPDCRYGALEALALLGPKADATAPQLRAALFDADPWVQALACNAIPRLSPKVAAECANDLLKMAVSSNPADPRRIAHRNVAVALFNYAPGNSYPRPILSGSLDGVGRNLLLPAVRSLLQNEDGMVRSCVSAVFKKLTPADLAVLLPDIMPAIERQAPSDEMFSDGVRVAGLELLWNLRIREGMALCASQEYSPGKRMEILQRYGVHAKEVIPLLNARNPDNKDLVKKFEKVITKIEASTDAPTLISLKDFINQASAEKTAVPSK